MRTCVIRYATGCEGDVDMKGTELSKYQICLLMWYFGIDGGEVRHSEWQEATLAKAERYAQSQDVDVEEWEKANYM